MSRILQNLIYPLLLAIVAISVWFLKPIEVIPGDVIHDTLSVPSDSASIIKEALVGLEIGTRAELIKKYGKVIFRTITKDSLNIIDSLRITDSTMYSIPTLFASDTFQYSGYNLLNEDTARVSLKVRTTALALLEPVNAIQIKTVIEGLTVSVPRAPDPSSREIAMKYWQWILGILTFGYLVGK